MKRSPVRVGKPVEPELRRTAALLILYVANAVFTPRFATVSTLNMLLQVSTTMFVAVG